MKKSDLVDLSVKVIGIYVIVTSVFYLKDLYMVLSFASKPEATMNMSFYFIGITLSLLLGLIMTFKSHGIAKKITKEDAIIEISSKIDMAQLLEIALTIIGLLILIFKFTFFFSAVYRQVNQLFVETPFMQQMIATDIATLLQYVLGFVLISKSASLSKWLVSMKK
ncbi:hypothetical protein [Marinifilum caeruleilacunae]|uniref:Uncharacterized protein n=1 Tax=Marinifilum caeruleilacunae TaxID=2499076 RepID=A0ABX1WRH4_9BACT|nr:hypothetical protein [Marinifilum caeruleilacunae]NOU58597.1 hypothetical protein [Marinifilum caeruleilacunae]